MMISGEINPHFQPPSQSVGFLPGMSGGS